MKKFILLLLYFLSILNLRGVEFLDVSLIGEDPVSLPEYITVYEDNTRQKTINDIKNHDIEFKKVKSTKEAFNFSYSKSAFWLKIPIKNTSQNKREFKLDIPYSMLELVEFYIPTREGYTVLKSGYTVPYNKIPYKYRHPVFPFNVPENSEDYYYVRATSTNSINVPIRIWNNDSFTLQERNDYVQQSLYFGAMISMGIFNLFLFFAIKDKYYLVYVVFIIFSGLAIVSLVGIGNELLWRDSPAFTRVSVNVFVSLAFIVCSFFMRGMLDLPKNSPRFNQIGKWLVLALVVSLVLFLYDFSKFIKFLIYAQGIFTFYMLLTGIVSAIKGQRVAYFFVTAFAVLFLMIILALFRALGILPSNAITNFGVQIGSVTEMMLLAFALADRYITLKREKERAEALIKENLERSNQELETKVEERTHKLNETLKVIQLDLALAKKIQQNSLPTKKEFPQKINVVTLYNPMSEVGGDYYDVYRFSENLYRFFIADATGHGVQAAMITMAVKGIYDNIKNFHLDPAQVIGIFNNEYLLKYKSLNSFLTGIVLDINVEEKKITYASAGHPPAILLQNNSSIQLERTGKLLGLMKDSSYQIKEYSFSEGDKLYLFTDGIFEEFNQNQEEFGIERLEKILFENKTNSPQEAIQFVMNELNSFLDGSEKQDDITILGIEF